ncbi:hypothetical protein D3C72_1767420 [compost metagenome]
MKVTVNADKFRRIKKIINGIKNFFGRLIVALTNFGADPILQVIKRVPTTMISRIHGWTVQSFLAATDIVNSRHQSADLLQLSI